MKKKQTKKLVLAKETVQRLDAGQLARAAGGEYFPRTDTVWWACWSSTGCPNSLDC